MRRNNVMNETLNKVKIDIKATNGELIPVSCFIRDICEPVTGQSIEFAQNHYDHLKGLHLADKNSYNHSLDIDILIGADHYWDFFGHNVVRGVSGPVALESRVGYVLSGPLDSDVVKSSSHSLVTHVMKVHVDCSLEDQLHKFLGN